MIQLDNKKKIILIGAFIVVIFILFFSWRFVVKNKGNNQSTILSTIDSSNTLPVRSMTEKEKVKVNIEASQNAEVVNDQNGFFVYQLKK